MSSQIESIRSTQYTSLYENKLFESRSSQWRRLVKILKTIEIVLRLDFYNPFNIDGTENGQTGDEKQL